MTNKEVKVLLASISVLRFQIKYDYVQYEMDVIIQVGRKIHEGSVVGIHQIRYLNMIKNKLIRIKDEKTKSSK